MLDGFKKFIMRGNVIDLAVGVIIGAAFKPIIDALTDKILLRLISAIFGKPSFNEVGTFYIGTTPILHRDDAHRAGLSHHRRRQLPHRGRGPLLLYRHANEQAGRTQEVRPGRSRGGSLGRSPPPHGDQGRPHQRRPGASPPVGRQPVMWGAGQTRVPLPCRRRLAPTRPSVRFVSAAWLRRAIQRLASSAVRTLGGSRGRVP